jgi:histidine triad (HIT) family protein
MSGTASDCLFCKIVAGQIPAKITYRDDEVVAFADIKPAAPLHELVIPVRHITNVAAVEAKDAALIGKLMIVAADRARAAGASDGFRVVTNNGAGAGQSVFHLHLHVLAGRPLSWPPG